MKTRFPFPHLSLAAALLALAPGGAVGQSKKPVPEKTSAASPAKSVKLTVAKPGATAADSPAPALPAEASVDPNLPPHQRPVRLFSLDGRYLDARLLSVSGSIITVERLADQQRFDVSLESLDAPSVKRVQSWMERDPEAMDFALDISARKRLVESDSFESQGRKLKSSQWVYDVELSNLSRNDLRDASLEFRVVYNDEVELVKSVMYPGKGGHQFDGEGIDLPEMPFNGRAEFTTPPIAMHSYEYIPLRGRREYFRDEITGIWIRVIRHDEVIAEYQSNPGAMKSLAWDGGKETGIEIRDPFRDQFEEKR